MGSWAPFEPQESLGLDQAKPSVVSIVRSDGGKAAGEGVGLVIGEGGDVITHSAEVTGSPSFEIRTADEKSYSLRRITIADATSALTVFTTKAPRGKLKPARVAASLPRRGDPVFVINPGDAACKNVSLGAVSSAEVLAQMDLVLVEAPVASVGGLVLNASGDLIGAVRSVESPGRVAVIAGKSILSLLNRAGARYSVSNRGRSSGIQPGPDGVRNLGEEIIAEAVKRVEPVYPRKALANRVAGTVKVGVLIDERGSVIRAWALDGNPLLQEAAIGAAYAWKFAPASFGGGPIAAGPSRSGAS